MSNDSNRNKGNDKDRNPANRSQSEINPDTRSREPVRNPNSDNDRKGRNVDIELENQGNEIEGRELQTSPKNSGKEMKEGFSEREKQQNKKS